MLPHLRPNPALPRVSAALLRPSLPRTTELARCYATQTGGSGAPKRRNVTILSDDGRYEWGELSGREKVARATQQSLNFVVIVAGAVLTVRRTLVELAGGRLH